MLVRDFGLERHVVCLVELFSRTRLLTFYLIKFLLALSKRELLIFRFISRSKQCSTTGVTKAVVCAILSVGWCI